MTEKLGVPSGNIGSGSALLLADTAILAAGATRKSSAIDVIMAGKIGIDIVADQDCTVQVVRLPVGETEGAVSTLGTVTAGIPAFFVYTSLLCPAIKIIVSNPGAVDMTSFAMYVRGGA